MQSIKVRFNLGRGQNYMKWKIVYPSGVVEYHSPSSVQLVMKDCKLKNNPKIALKIFEGSNKDVCSWVICKDIQVKFGNFDSCDSQENRITYNPKKAPNWVFGGENADGKEFQQITSLDYGLYKN